MDPACRWPADRGGVSSTTAISAACIYSSARARRRSSASRFDPIRRPSARSGEGLLARRNERAGAARLRTHRAGQSDVEAGKAFAIRRPQPDPLVANGIRGSNVAATLAGGAGAGDAMDRRPGRMGVVAASAGTPHPHQWCRLLASLDAPQWLDERYFRGATDEHAATDDAWTAYGRHRGGRSPPRSMSVTPASPSNWQATARRRFSVGRPDRTCRRHRRPRFRRSPARRLVQAPCGRSPPRSVHRHRPRSCRCALRHRRIRCRRCV